MLLIVTNKAELSADYLILTLKKRGIDFFRLNTEDLGGAVDIEITCSGEGTDFELLQDEQVKVTASEIGAVYFHHPSPPDGIPDIPVGQQPFVKSELLELLRSLWRIIPREKWLNHPQSLWRAENKLQQLLAARQVGLEIPNTLITKRQESVRNFLKSNRGKVVTKAIRHGFLVEGKEMVLAGTQEIEPEFPDSMGEYATVPAVFQEAIPRGIDLRVVVVGDEVFSVAIKAESGLVDWRISDITYDDLTYSLTDLPSEVERACLELVREFGLGYSSIDMIHAEDGRFVFLELNPSGQWAWLEQSTGCQIRDALIRNLVRAS